MKGSLQRKLKGASVWPFNARSRSAYKLKSTVSPRTGLIFFIVISFYHVMLFVKNCDFYTPSALDAAVNSNSLQ